MKTETINVSRRSLGYAEVTLLDGTGESATITFYEYSRTGFIRRKVRAEVDIFSLACIAGKARRAIKWQREYLDRLDKIALDEGY